MHIKESFTITASQNELWEVFMDMEELAKCIPGCKSIETINEKEFKADMSVKLPFMNLKFEVLGEMKNIIEPNSFQVEMRGKPSNLAGTFMLVMNVNIESIEKDKTKVNYDMRINLTGRFASLGDLLLKRTINSNAEEFVKNVQSLFQ